MLRGLLLVGLLGAGGCASELAEKNQRLERQIEEMRRTTDGDRQALRQLENRIFVLEDKLDTAEVARGKVAGLEPRLPVITKHKPEAETPPAVPPPPAPTAYDDGPPDDGPPIVIKMDGSSGRLESSEPKTRARGDVRRQRSAALPDLASVNERLPVVPLPKTGAQAPTVEPLTVYQEARAALGRREHAAAIAGFKHFLERWPSHDYADNAQYWLGESYYDQADFQTALVEFRAVVQRYPNGNKAPDALLKVGYCLAKLGESAAASDVLAQVAQIYPKTDAARLAQKRLDEAARGQP
jgi:tol-pal system protein YbgF